MWILLLPKNVISVFIKIYKAEHPKVTQTDIISHFSKEWGVTTGR